MTSIPREPGVELYWLPLGAGGHSVRLNGKVYEAVAAQIGSRHPCELYHSALEVTVPEARYTIEMAPIPRGRSDRGVVAEGPVGSRWLQSLRIFRYEIRRWPGGVIPDVAEAVDSPQHLASDRMLAQRLLELVPEVPTPVWGRDELHGGEMWNSNSLVSWLLARSGIGVGSVLMPAGGRAPGWNAGLAAAARSAGPALEDHEHAQLLVPDEPMLGAGGHERRVPLA